MFRSAGRLADSRPLPLLPPASARPIDSFGDRDNVERLSSETEAIRILPGHRGSGRTRADRSAESGAPGAGDDLIGDFAARPAKKDRWSRAADDGVHPLPARRHEPAPDRQPAIETATRDTTLGEPTPSAPAKRATASEATATPPDLAALIASPGFREIHTQTVIQGLELLSDLEPQRRLRGAQRIAAAGSEARTALPILREVPPASRTSRCGCGWPKRC
jgi:hypothetical protein